MTDLRTRPLQSVLLALVMLMAAAMLTLAITLRDRASDPFDGVMKSSNGAHAWFYGPDRELMDSIATRAGVVGVSGPFPRLQARTNGLEADPNISLWGMPAQLPEVGHPVMKEGRWVAGANEIVLEAGYAHTRRLAPGASIEVVTPRGTTTLTVVGTALIAAREPYPMNAPGQAWVADETLRAMAGGEVAWEMGVKLADPGRSGGFIADALGAPGSAPELFANDWSEIRADIADRSEVSAIFFMVFGGFAAAAVALIVANVVSSSVLANLREVGLLKAVGFTPSQVTATFLAPYLLLAAVAGIAGAIAGSLLAPWLVAGDSSGVLSVPRGVELDPGVIVPVALGVGTLVFVCTLVPAWRAGRISAMAAIAGQRRPSMAPSRLAMVGRTLRLPAVVVLGLKDVFARPVRAVFTIIAIAIAMGTTVMGLMIEATFAEAKDDPSMFSNEAFHIEVLANGRAEAERAASVGSADPAVKQTGTNLELFGTVPGRPRPFLIDAYGGDRDGVLPRAVQGRQPSAAGEVMLAEGLSESLRARPGDTVTFQVQTFAEASAMVPLGEGTFMVVGVFEESDDDGQVLVTWRETVERFATPDMREEVGFNLNDTHEATRFVEMLRTTLGPEFRVHDEVKVNRDAMAENASAGRPVLIPLVTLLVMIAVVNVLTTLLFAVRERYRDIGILKAVGLSPREVVAMVAVGGAVLAVVAAAIGIPGGIWVTETLFSYFGRGEGWKENVGVVPPWWQLALLGPFALLLAAVGAIIPARRAARMPVADALRFE